MSRLRWTRKDWEWIDIALSTQASMLPDMADELADDDSTTTDWDRAFATISKQSDRAKLLVRQKLDSMKPAKQK